MTIWILAVLGVWVVQTFLPTWICLLQQKDKVALGVEHMKGRDHWPEPGVIAARAERARLNMLEALPVFVTLALLVEIKGVGEGLAAQGAMVFFIARVLYVPAYMIAIFGLRSVIWSAGWVGLGMMIMALLG